MFLSPTDGPLASELALIGPSSADRQSQALVQHVRSVGLGSQTTAPVQAPARPPTLCHHYKTQPRAWLQLQQPINFKTNTHTHTRACSMHTVCIARLTCLNDALRRQLIWLPLAASDENTLSGGYRHADQHSPHPLRAALRAHARVHSFRMHHQRCSAGAGNHSSPRLSKPRMQQQAARGRTRVARSRSAHIIVSLSATESRNPKTQGLHPDQRSVSICHASSSFVFTVHLTAQASVRCVHSMNSDWAGRQLSRKS